MKRYVLIGAVLALGCTLGWSLRSFTGSSTEPGGYRLRRRATVVTV